MKDDKTNGTYGTYGTYGTNKAGLADWPVYRMANHPTGSLPTTPSLPITPIFSYLIIIFRPLYLVKYIDNISILLARYVYAIN